MNSEHILEILRNHVREVLPELADREITRADSLRELGANSLDRADILIGVIEDLSLSVPRIELAGPQNIGELVDLLQEKLRRA
jgi:polyketide biosynthesis acyl carrier protein